MITIASSIKIPIKGKGNIYLRYLLLDRLTKLSKLTNILYSR